MQAQKQNKDSDFGDFEEIETEKPSDKNIQQQPQVPTRIRMPRDKEQIGIIVQRLGGNRMDIKATDGKIRNCRVPGRYRRRLWLRPNDLVLIVPWEYDDSKADIIYKYPPVAVQQLKKRHLIDSLFQDF